MVGMKAYAIQESTKQLISNITMLSKHLRAYDEYFKRIGNNLSTTVNAYNLASKELNKIDRDVLKIAGEGMGIEPEILDKPSNLE